MANKTKTCNRVYDTSLRKHFKEYNYGYYNETLYDVFVENLKGQYNKYDILRDGYFFDFTLDDIYIADFHGKLFDFINDDDLRYSRSIKLNPDSNHFLNVFSLISLRNFINIFITLTIFCYPFRLISLMSWYKFWREIISYLNIIFRMIPSMLIMSIFYGSLLLSYSLMLYLLFNEKIQEYSSFMIAMFNLINSYSIITKYFNQPVIEQSLTISEIHFLFNLIIYVCMVLICFFIVCTMIQTFRDSANLEKKHEDDEVMSKITELEESIEKLSRRKKDNSLTNLNNIKQIIWLGFEGPSDVYNEKLYLISQGVKKEKNSEDNKMLLFNNSRQIISFFKYLFAIKPKMQFKNLEDKFVIVIECSGEVDHHEVNFQVKENELKQINDLFDWLGFAGCKIPVAVYTPDRLDKNTRMVMINAFSNVSFIDDKFDLNIFLKINVEESLPLKSPKKRTHFSDVYAANYNKFNLKLDKESKENNLSIKDLDECGKFSKKETVDVINLPRNNSKNSPFNQINVKPILKNIENNAFRRQVNMNNFEYEGTNNNNKLLLE